MRLTVNGEVVETRASTLGDLLGVLPAGSAVAVNNEVVPRVHVAGRPLADGDVVEFVTAVAGG